MMSAGNRGVFQSCLQVPHVHVFLVAPLGAGHMTQSGADQHQGRVAVRECTHHASAAANFPVQPLNHIIRANAGSVLIGKITVSQRFLDTILYFLRGLLQLHFSQLSNHSFRFFTGRLLALLGMDRLKHLGH